MNISQNIYSSYTQINIFIQTSMSSKIINMHSEFFANLIVDAANLVKFTDPKVGSKTIFVPFIMILSGY